MDYAEQETAVDELEKRVERLRALYEQYFMGIEKIEPLIPRKDVDRRIWLLRREKIRNTGLRFKMQQVVSRYNTFGQYWARILREIENGTYKRDVAKAAKRFGADAAALNKKKLGVADLERMAAQQAEQEQRAERERQQSYDLPDDDLDADEDTSPFRRNADGTISTASTAPPPAAPVKLHRPVVHQLPVELEEDDDLFAGLNTASVSSAPPPRTSASVAVPMPPRPSVPVPTSTSVAVPRPSGPVPPMPPRPGVPAPTSTSVAAPRPSGPVPPMPPRPSVPVPTSTSVAVPRPSMPVPPRPSAPVPPAPGVTTPRPSAPQVPARPAAAASPAPVARPATPPARPAAPVSGAELTDARVREIYSRYVDAKRQCNEPTAAITMEGLAKSLRESAPKIREKHGGKSVDFDVVIKDGRAVLKPVLKT